MVFINLKVDFENAMCFAKVRDATVVCLKNKRFCWHHFSILYDLFFKIDVFLPCDKMSQEVLQPLES
jgi:hypothetical protein